MDEITLEVARSLSTLETTAALLRSIIEKGNLTPEDWMTVGKYVGHIGRTTTTAATLIGVLVQMAKTDLYNNPNSAHGTGN